MDNLDSDYVEQPFFNMEEIYSESNCLTPFSVVLVLGTDPIPNVEELERKFGITQANGRFVNISIGQGQEQVAIKS